MALTAALLHSPSTHNRAEGGARSAFSFGNFKKWSLNFMRSRDEEMQTKRHTFGAHSILPNRLKDRERGKEPSKIVAAIATLSPAVVTRRLRGGMEAMVEFLPRLPLRHRRHPSSLKRQWRRGRPDSRPHIVGRVEGPSDTQDGGRIEKVEARWGGKAGISTFNIKMKR